MLGWVVVGGGGGGGWVLSERESGPPFFSTACRKDAINDYVGKFQKLPSFTQLQNYVRNAGSMPPSHREALDHNAGIISTTSKFWVPLTRPPDLLNSENNT